MNEYIEKLLSFLSFISINDIKKYLEIDTTHTLDIFGNYNSFVSSLNNPQSDLYTYVSTLSMSSAGCGCFRHDRLVQYCDH